MRVGRKMGDTWRGGDKHDIGETDQGMTGMCIRQTTP